MSINVQPITVSSLRDAIREAMPDILRSITDGMREKILQNIELGYLNLPDWQGRSRARMKYYARHGGAITAGLYDPTKLDNMLDSVGEFEPIAQVESVKFTEASVNKRIRELTATGELDISPKGTITKGSMPRPSLESRPMSETFETLLTIGSPNVTSGRAYAALHELEPGEISKNEGNPPTRKYVEPAFDESVEDAKPFIVEAIMSRVIEKQLAENIPSALTFLEESGVEQSLTDLLDEIRETIEEEFEEMQEE